VIRATPTLRLPGTGTHPRHTNCRRSVMDQSRHGVLITAGNWDRPDASGNFAEPLAAAIPFW
jgi:hypothetical protein